MGQAIAIAAKAVGEGLKERAREKVELAQAGKPIASNVGSPTVSDPGSSPIASIYDKIRGRDNPSLQTALPVPTGPMRLPGGGSDITTPSPEDQPVNPWDYWSANQRPSLGPAFFGR